MGGVILWGERSSQGHRRAVHAEVALCYVNTVDLLRTAAASQVEPGARVVECHDLLEQVLLTLKKVKLRDVVKITGNFDGRRQKIHHAIRVGIVERLEQHGVHDREDCGVGSDAQGQCGHDS